MRPFVATIPSLDDAFRVHVDAAIERIGICAPETMERELRRAYPAARIQVASSLSTIGGEPRWYAYRDGRPTGAADSPWWLDADLPWTLLDKHGRYVEASTGAAELFGVPREAIIGAASGAFTLHEEDPRVARRLLETLRRAGELRSTALVRRPDGTNVPIDFHVAFDATTGTSRTVMRQRNDDLRDHLIAEQARPMRSEAVTA